MRGVGITGAVISGALFITLITIVVYAVNTTGLSGDILVRGIIGCVVLGLFTVAFIVASSFGAWRAAWDNAWANASGRRNDTD